MNSFLKMLPGHFEHIAEMREKRIARLDRYIF